MTSGESYQDLLTVFYLRVFSVSLMGENFMDINYFFFKIQDIFHKWMKPHAL